MSRACREHFPRHRLQRKPLVCDPGMHHGTCVWQEAHVPVCPLVTRLTSMPRPDPDEHPKSPVPSAHGCILYFNAIFPHDVNAYQAYTVCNPIIIKLTIVYTIQPELGHFIFVYNNKFKLFLHIFSVRLHFNINCRRSMYNKGGGDGVGDFVYYRLESFCTRHRAAYISQIQQYIFR